MTLVQILTEGRPIAAVGVHCEVLSLRLDAMGIDPSSHSPGFYSNILTGTVPFPGKIAGDNRKKTKHPNISATCCRIQRDPPGSGIKTPTRKRERRQEPGQKKKDEASDWAPFGLAQMVFGY
jgi:hypothetical protein